MFPWQMYGSNVVIKACNLCNLIPLIGSQPSPHRVGFIKFNDLKGIFQSGDCFSVGLGSVPLFVYLKTYIMQAFFVVACTSGHTAHI